LKRLARRCSGTGRCLPPLWTLECLFRSNVIIHRARKTIQEDDCRLRRRSWLRFPWLSPIRNSFEELRGLCRRSCFGPRTCVRGITNSSKHVGALNQGFPFSPLQCRHCRTRRGGGWYNAGRGGFLYNSPKHRGALDRLPFQGFARRSGIQVFRLYSRLSPVMDRKICGESAIHLVRGLEGGTQRFIIIFTHLRTRARTHKPMRTCPRTHIGSS